MKRLLIFAALGLAAMVAGCSLLPYGPQVKAISDQVAVTAVEDRKDFNDKKLTISLAALCDNSIGAVNRHPDRIVRDMIDRMCDGAGQGITAERLADLMTTLDQLRGPP
jgi:hypothetical protein